MSTAKSPRVFEAPLETQGPVPAYKVVQLEGPFEKEVTVFNEATRKNEKKMTVHPTGFMVEFPRGHSLFFYTLEEVDAAGFGAVVPLIRSMMFEAEANKEMPQPSIQRVIEKNGERK